MKEQTGCCSARDHRALMTVATRAMRWIFCNQQKAQVGAFPTKIKNKQNVCL